MIPTPFYYYAFRLRSDIQAVKNALLPPKTLVCLRVKSIAYK